MPKTRPTGFHPGKQTAVELNEPLSKRRDAVPPCRYRRGFAGFWVCRALDGIAVVTGTDCRACPIPGTVRRVNCIFLWARLKLVPEARAVWTCGATNDRVDPDSRDDCAGCTQAHNRIPRPGAFGG